MKRSYKILRTPVRLWWIGLFGYLCVINAAVTAQFPNILFIYLDDMGYGDFGFINPDSNIPTPEMDHLAQQGVLFTNAHTPATVCGPSRYGLLTGRYPWRRGKGGMGNGAKFRDVFIEEGRLTLASLLKQIGYNTAQMGKWGLRHNYSEVLLPGREPGHLGAYDFTNNKLLGAQLFGFDYTWTLTYLDQTSSDIKQPFENSSPVHPDLSPMDPHRWFPESAKKIREYLHVYSGEAENPRFHINPENPFFIYWDPTGPHWPYVPNPPFVGKTSVGDYGDFVMEIDYWIGQVFDVLDELDLAKDTLVILTSDNGPDKFSYDRLESSDHKSMGHWRGLKTNVFEGGHRLPLIVRWPGVVKPNGQSDELISLTDWFATFAEITRQTIPQGAGEDSISLMTLLADPCTPGDRNRMIHHSTRGDFAIREGDWVYIDSANAPSGEPQWFKEMLGVMPSNETGQLYNLSDDPSQTRNLFSCYPEKVKDLRQQLTELKANP